MIGSKSSRRAVVGAVALSHPVTVFQRLINAFAAIMLAVMYNVALIVEVLCRDNIKLAVLTSLATVSVSRRTLYITN